MKLLIPENPLQLLPSLAVKIGLNEAIVLQQIHYWLRSSPHVKEGRKWIYNSYEEWQEQFPFWSITTIGRIMRSLEDKKIIITKQFGAKGYDRRKWYTIEYQNDIIEDTNLAPSKDTNLAPSPLTENTSENTTEILSNNPPADLDIELSAMLTLWKDLFPEKPQPRIETKTIRDKVRIRLKDDWFRENWKEAMIRAAQSPTLHKESWFGFKYFIRSEETAQNCYDRWMAWKDPKRPGAAGDPIQPGMTPEKWKEIKQAHQNKKGEGGKPDGKEEN